MMCSYGCGLEGKHTLKNGKLCCSKSHNSCPKNKQRVKEGVVAAYKAGTKGYTYNPNSAWSRGKSLTPNSALFVENSTYSNEMIKNRIVKDNLLVYECSVCKIKEWQDNPLVLDLDHINGNNRDHRISNLRYLCPNCHSQTTTYKGRNINTGKLKVTDTELLTAYKKCTNIRQTLLAVGLTPKGANYNRLKKLIATVVE
jgi:Zn finger protein HypA/HybF involved in hydrogenase expression